MPNKQRITALENIVRDDWTCQWFQFAVDPYLFIDESLWHPLQFTFFFFWSYRETKPLKFGPPKKKKNGTFLPFFKLFIDDFYDFMISIDKKVISW